MRALRAADPAEVGGHRLVARLGAGGMGVVYLARTPAGDLVALKVIRAEHAADAHFRARFRREARLAARVRGRWVVPVTGADPEARAPWLATAFVPGPSLAEAVAAHGPLPPRTVLVLGRRVADALAGLHAAGLVHRDVKPGNVLIARDGPRLIDFGIARAAGATALTAPDAVVGTPGFLSPEQARVRDGEVGPASDVFALGCVLVHAAAGRAPFGAGDPAAVLYRTVHEEPDLDGIGRLPDPMRTAITRCLAKDPAARPTAAELRDLLDAVRLPRDPREHAPPADVQDRLTGDQDGDWLPSAVLRLVAASAARALDPPPRAAPPAEALPGAAPTADAPPADSAPTQTRPPSAPARLLSRRRALVVGGSAAAVVAAGGIGALALRHRTPGGAGGVPTHTIGLQGTGTEQERGARLAVAAHNARTDARFRLALKRVDDHGRADEAGAAARRLLADHAVCAVLGPTTEAAVRAAAPRYAAANTPLVLVSGTAGPPAQDEQQTTDQRTLCVTRVADDALGMPLAFHLTRSHTTPRTAVIEDGAAGRVSAALARGFRSQPPGGGTATVHPLAAEEDDVRPAVTRALATRPGAVVYAGTSPARAAACARALAAAGFTGARATIEPVMRPAFLKAAGPAADGWVVAAPYAEPQSMDTEAARTFTAAYHHRHGTAPGPWAVEAYDAVTLIARALDALGGGTAVTAGQVCDRLFHTTVEGVAKPLRFLTGDLHDLNPDHASFLYRAAHGRFHFLGRYDQAPASS